MNQPDPLANLHPLRTPEPLGWWPLAPGWWLLMALIGLALVAAAVWLLRRHRANAYRRTALQQLQALRDRQQREPDPLVFLASLNGLLKSVALRTFGQRTVAAASGAEWVAFLNRTAPADIAFDPALANAQYRPETPEVDLDRLGDMAALWIRRHRRPQ